MSESPVLYETNEFQTQITKELKESLDEEVFSNIIEFIESVPFVKALVSPNRPRVSQLKKKNGRVIVDCENPHILENMEYFIKDRIHYEKHGYYTAAKFSHNQN